jgi:hypothetical protein
LGALPPSDDEDDETPEVPRDEGRGGMQREFRGIADDLNALSDDFQHGRMRAFGPNTAAVFARLDAMREEQERLCQSHLALERVFQDSR